MEYTVGTTTGGLDDVDPDLQHLLRSAAVSYIHPQEGAALLRKAQEKFKKRLFSNWGRHPSVANRLKEAQSEWEKLRQTANDYLSAALTDRLRKIWPDSDTKVDLPERIEDIVAISDITFRSASSLPPVTLPSQGTGAQSAILYQTHYLLDSDRTLHRGIYFPIWLLEEPESFLHADIALQLARLLSSSEWLGEIQMVISTHSPIILAASQQNPGLAEWVVFENHNVLMVKPVSDVTDDDVATIGQMMGDVNFDVYFSAATRGPLVFIEDSKDVTRKAIEAAGIPVTRGLEGVSQIKKYLAVLPSVGSLLQGKAYFVADSDKGQKELTTIISDSKEDATVAGWRRFQVSDKVYLILLPANAAVEDLFGEWDDTLEGAIDDLYQDPFTLRSAVPTGLSNAATTLRRLKPQNRSEAKEALHSVQDVKDRFWKRVEHESLAILPVHANALKQLMGIGTVDVWSQT